MPDGVLRGIFQERPIAGDDNGIEQRAERLGLCHRPAGEILRKPRIAHLLAPTLSRWTNALFHRSLAGSVEMGRCNRAFAAVVYHFRSSVHSNTLLAGPENVRHDTISRWAGPTLGRAFGETPADPGHRRLREIRPRSSSRFFARR